MSVKPFNSAAAAAEASTAAERVTQAIVQAHTLALVTHDRPDGDALGSMVALGRAARAAGRVVRLVCDQPLPRRYAFLLDGEDWRNTADFAAAAADADAVVILDTCAAAQLESIAAHLPAVADRTVVIDHHRTPEPLGICRWIDPSAAATGVLVTELLERVAWPVDAPAALAAVTAIVSDTGWLRFSSTDGRTLRAVARWVDAGVQPDALYRQLYESDRPERIALLGRLLAGLQLKFDNRFALMSLSKDDFAATGATPDETENLINEVLRIESVELAAMLVENGGAIRVSLRSKRQVDVAALAQRFSGGGHTRAAGFRRAAALRTVARDLTAAAREALGA